MKRTLIATALALGFAGAAQAATTELVIYKQANFKGPSQTVKGEVNVLEGGFAREAASLIVRGGYWEACTGDRFKGDCRAFAPGEYPSLDPMFHQRITSVRFLGNDPKIARSEARQDRREDRRAASAGLELAAVGDRVGAHRRSHQHHRPPRQREDGHPQPAAEQGQG